MHFNNDKSVHYELDVEFRLKNNIPSTNNFNEFKNSALNRKFDRVKPSVETLLRKIRNLDFTVTSNIKLFVNNRILNSSLIDFENRFHFRRKKIWIPSF